MPSRHIFSYWILPTISGIAWLATLLSLLLFWVTEEDGEIYEWMEDGQTIAYISDVGATELQPLFIIGAILTSVFLDLAFIYERWLRHNGRLIANGSTREKVLSVISILFAIVGTVGLILLAVFDTHSHPTLHIFFLGLFILGYMMSAIFICWEYRRLTVHYRDQRLFRISFWVKLAFIIVELGLIIGFIFSMARGRWNTSAILEWIVSFFFTFYAMSFILDLWPAIATKNGHLALRKTAMEHSRNATDVEAANVSSHRYEAIPLI